MVEENYTPDIENHYSVKNHYYNQFWFSRKFPLKIFVQWRFTLFSVVFQSHLYIQFIIVYMLSDFHSLYAFYDCSNSALLTEPTFLSSPFYYYEVISYPHCRVILVQHWPLATPCSKCILQAHRFSAYLGFLYWRLLWEIKLNVSSCWTVLLWVLLCDN